MCLTSRSNWTPTCNLDRTWARCRTSNKWWCLVINRTRSSQSKPTTWIRMPPPTLTNLSNRIKRWINSSNKCRTSWRALDRMDRTCRVVRTSNPPWHSSNSNSFRTIRCSNNYSSSSSSSNKTSSLIQTRHQTRTRISQSRKESKVTSTDCRCRTSNSSYWTNSSKPSKRVVLLSSSNNNNSNSSCNRIRLVSQANRTSCSSSLICSCNCNFNRCSRIRILSNSRTWLARRTRTTAKTSSPSRCSSYSSNSSSNSSNCNRISR
jgi:hypothetical protein